MNLEIGAWRAIGTNLLIIAITALMLPSVAWAGGSGTISFRYGDGPSVVAEAQSFETSSSPTGNATYVTTPSATSPEGAGTVETPQNYYVPTDVPDGDSFSAIVDVPNPCLRRKYGGNYCQAATPEPADPDNNPRPGGDSGPPPPSPEEIVAMAIDRAIALAPDPQLEVAPARVGLTGLESYFWLADPPTAISATAGVSGLTVTAQAVPVQFVWDFGDGEELATTSPGARWTPRSGGDISHLYETKGSYDLSVEVIWAASYSINGGAWTSIGYFSTSDTRPYPVREMVAVLVPGRN